jgi:hypothetical protein
LTTVVYLDGNLVASINYLSKYSDRAMIFVSNTGLVFNSYFNSPSINLNSQNGTPE